MSLGSALPRRTPSHLAVREFANPLVFLRLNLSCEASPRWELSLYAVLYGYVTGSSGQMPMRAEPSVLAANSQLS